MKADIDRHILSEIVENQTSLKQQIEGAFKILEKIMQLNSRNDALYLHLVGEISKVDTHRNSETKKGGEINADSILNRGCVNGKYANLFDQIAERR